LGGLSDHYGRKPLLVISSIGLFLCTCMIAWGVEIGSYSKYGIIFIIFWRLIKGVFSANVGLSQSALADYAQARGLQGNIGFTFVSFGMMTSTGSVVGGLIGGLIPIKFGFASAFFILALLYLLNAIWLLFFFKETLLQKRAKSEIRFKLWSGIENLKEAMFNISPGLTWMLYTLFFYRLGWQIFVHFSQLYIVGRFNPPHAESAIGTLWIIGMGIYCLLQYFVNQPLNKLGMGKEKPMRFTLFIQGGFILASAFAGELFPYFMLLGIAGAASNAFNSSNSAAAVGSLAPIDKKGMVLGGGQAIQGIAHLLSAFFAIVTFYLGTNLLIICSGVSIIIAGFILNKGYQSIQKSRFVV
jgi:MFS transporter, DHA1 family, tetracycline resistance protein